MKKKLRSYVYIQPDGIHNVVRVGQKDTKSCSSLARALRRAIKGEMRDLYSEKVQREREDR